MKPLRSFSDVTFTLYNEKFPRYTYNERVVTQNKPYLIRDNANKLNLGFFYKYFHILQITIFVQIIIIMEYSALCSKTP